MDLIAIKDIVKEKLVFNRDNMPEIIPKGSKAILCNNSSLKDNFIEVKYRNSRLVLPSNYFQEC